MQDTILIVDDEASQRLSMQTMLKDQPNVRLLMAKNGAEALDMILSGHTPLPSLVLMDLNMPDMHGLKVLKKIRPIHPHLPVIVVTANDAIDTAVEAMQAGAQDFLVKPVEPQRLHVSVANALKNYRLTEELSRLQRSAVQRMQFSDMLSASEAFQQCVVLGKKAAASNMPVLLVGEQAVGKTTLAQAIHGGGNRAGKPFVMLDCTYVEDDQWESILCSPRGELQQAKGGTLLLRNIPAISERWKAWIEEELCPGKERVHDVRMMLTADPNQHDPQTYESYLDTWSVLMIPVPPLRERREDTARLAEYFMQHYCMLENKKVDQIAKDAMEALLAHAWPGNICQLENMMQRAVVLSEGKQLRMQDLFPQESGVSRWPRSEVVSLLDQDQKLLPYHQLEQQIFQKALAFCRGDVAMTAEQLQISAARLQDEKNASQ